MKFTANLYQQKVQALCLPDNLWTLPDPWGTCVESENLELIFVTFCCHWANILILKLANYCVLPPPPPDGGKIIIHNAGLYFGHVCPTSFQALPGSGCSKNAIQVKKSKKSFFENNPLKLYFDTYRLDLKSLRFLQTVHSIKLPTPCSSLSRMWTTPDLWCSFWIFHNRSLKIRFRLRDRYLKNYKFNIKIELPLNNGNKSIN